MRLKNSLIVVLGLFLGLGGCDSGGAAPFDTDPVDPLPGVATQITLSIYSDGWGDLLETQSATTEGPVVIDVYEDQPYTDPATYYVYAEASGFYTELYNCTKGEAIDVDLDAVPDAPNTVTGVIFATQSFFSDCYYANQTLAVTGPDGSTTLTTDAQGRFGLGNVALGTYTFRWSFQGEDFSAQVVNTAGTDYQDIFFAEPMQMAAPNLYLYPLSTTTVDVTLGFPQGGHVTESEPPYGDGWHVRVDPAGWINGEHGYLFYETSVPQQADTDAGWLLDGADFEGELRSLLTRYGFLGREIDDFVAFWGPRLGGSPWYAVYPQVAESLVTLDITPAPDRIRRVLFLIRPLDFALSLPAPPAPAPFPRDGFVALEWGVLVGI